MSPGPKLGFGWAMPVAVLLVVQVALNVWLARRGFEFTDEAYYLLHYLHWREFAAINTFFGAYFEWPFKMLGGSIPAIRVLGLGLLLAASAVLAWSVLRYVSPGDASRGTQGPFVLAAMAASLCYFSVLSTLRVPSYNMLALCAVQVSTALLLEVLRSDRPSHQRRAMIFGYGLALGACGLGKASSGAFLLLLHAVFFAFANRDWRPIRLVEITVLTLAGVAVNLAVVYLEHPGAMAVLREGVAMFAATDGRSPTGLANALRWEIQSLPLVLWPIAAGLLAVVWIAARSIGPSRPAAISAMTFVIVLLAVGGLMIKSVAHLWLPILALAMAMLWVIELANRPSARPLRSDLRELGVALLLLSLPFAVSFGTNNVVLEHTRLAGALVFIALLVRLRGLHLVGLLSRFGVAACLPVLCVPSLATQLLPALDVKSTYRQLTALGGQTLPLALRGGETAVLVDEQTRTTIRSVVDAARAAGLTPDEAVLDFTGDGPGLVYALQVRPLGVPWLFGGYPGSESAAARLIGGLTPESLAQAWLLTSETNPRAIRGWQQILGDRLGAGSHELVATVQIAAPYRWSPNHPDRVDLQLWRPARGRR